MAPLPTGAVGPAMVDLRAFGKTCTDVTMTVAEFYKVTGRQKCKAVQNTGCVCRITDSNVKTTFEVR